MITRPKSRSFVVLIVFSFLLAACGGRSAPAASATRPAVLTTKLPAESAISKVVTQKPVQVRTQTPTAPPAATAVSATRQPVRTATRPVMPTATALATQASRPGSDHSGQQTEDNTPLFYNLPPATLTTATGLYASPNRGDLIVQVPIPAGQTVYVMGRNASSSHLRVVWNTGVGWVPTSFTNYNGARQKMTALPVFTREPPGCAIPLTTQFGLGSTWTSKDKQRIAVVVDLFRSKFGDFPKSTLSLAVNGKEVETSRRPIVEQGQFSLKDVVFTLPGDLQPGDTLSYLLATSSNEPLTFMATIFSVPPACKWKLD